MKRYRIWQADLNDYNATPSWFEAREALAPHHEGYFGRGIPTGQKPSVVLFVEHAQA